LRAISLIARSCFTGTSWIAVILSCAVTTRWFCQLMWQLIPLEEPICQNCVESVISNGMSCNSCASGHSVSATRDAKVCICLCCTQNVSGSDSVLNIERYLSAIRWRSNSSYQAKSRVVIVIREDEERLSYGWSGIDSTQADPRSACIRSRTVHS